MNAKFSVETCSSLQYLPVLSSTASAQASSRALLVTSSGAALPHVTVEASSRARIEKVRTTTRCEPLVSHRLLRNLQRHVALPGFTQVKRDGIELAGSFTAQIDAEMAVSGVTETLTVTVASPIVATDHDDAGNQQCSRGPGTGRWDSGQYFAADSGLATNALYVDDGIRWRRRAQQRRAHAG